MLLKHFTGSSRLFACLGSTPNMQQVCKQCLFRENDAVASHGVEELLGKKTKTKCW